MRHPFIFRNLGACLGVVAIAVLGPAQTQHPHPQVSPAAKSGSVQFEDIARQAGLTALDVYGGEKKKDFIIETTGNGAAIFDYDNDGWPDIFLPNGSTVEGFADGERAHWSSVSQQSRRHIHRCERKSRRRPRGLGTRRLRRRLLTTTAISICSKLSGDRTCCFTTTATARSPT